MISFSGLTKKFYNTMLKFCFPERDPDTIDGEGSDDLDADSKGKKLKGTKKSKETNFYVPIEQKDDVEKMKVCFYSIISMENESKCKLFQNKKYGDDFFHLIHQRS